MIDFTLTSEQGLIQKTAREFAIEHLAPGVIERDDKAEFPTEQIKVMGELGFMGMMVPEEWSGAGLDTLTYVIAMEEIAAVELATSTIMSVNNSLVCQLFVDYGTEDQKEKYLTPLAIGKKLGAYSLSEPESGSDASNMRTFAKRERDHYVINGTKNWVTNGINGDIVILFCMTEKNVGYKGISAFVVEKGTLGLSTGKKENKFGVNDKTFIKLVNYCKNSKYIELKCLSVHIGSQILDHKPYQKT